MRRIGLAEAATDAAPKYEVTVFLIAESIEPRASGAARSEKPAKRGGGAGGAGWPGWPGWPAWSEAGGGAGALS